MVIIGIKKCNFTTKDGTDINGFNLFITDEINSSIGKGSSCDKYFLSVDKFNSFGVTVGDNVEIRYNKYGKISDIIKISK